MQSFRMRTLRGSRQLRMRQTFPIVPLRVDAIPSFSLGALGNASLVTFSPLLCCAQPCYKISICEEILFGGKWIANTQSAV